MVVVQSTPSTSNPHRKNRRSLSKKKKSRVVGESAAKPPTAEDEEILIDVDGEDVAPPTEAPVFEPAPASAGQSSLKSETRRVAIPPHRMTPLKKEWINIFGPLTEMLGLQVRMNVQRKCVEIRVRLHIIRLLGARTDVLQTSKHTKELGALQKGADFVKAFALGFDVNVSRCLFSRDTFMISVLTSKFRTLLLFLD